MSVLREILAATRVEIARLREALPPRVGHRPLDVRARLARNEGSPLRLIAEVKLRSPSAGALSRALVPGERAAAYEEAGASMVSVLVDRAHFDGGYEHLAEARARVSVPLLAKGFTLDEIQLEAAARAGADAVLLIVRILEGALLSELVAATRARGMEPLIEVVDEAELARALDAGARVIGVNARDLDTLAMDRERARRVVAQIPEGHVALWFSGLSDPSAVERIATTGSGLRGIDGALVGESLMREDDPRPLLRAMVAASTAS